MYLGTEGPEQQVVEVSRHNTITEEMESPSLLLQNRESSKSSHLKGNEEQNEDKNEAVEDGPDDPDVQNVEDVSRTDS